MRTSSAAHTEMSDLEFWALSTVALPRVFLPVALLSLVFWPGALILALRLKRRR